VTARAWWWAARPATLAASVAPVLVGTAIAAADGSAKLWPGLAALVVAIAMQVGVNYANDYSDFVRGADTPRRVGPRRAASSGLIPAVQVRSAAIAAFAVAALVGLGLSLATDWRLLIAGALAVAAGWLYTGGPRPYGYSGLGEVFVFIFFGLVATAGTTYVQEHRVPESSLIAGAALGLLASAILMLNNLRDSETDALAGKRTQAVRLGRSRARFILALTLALALLLPLSMGGYAWLPLLLLPVAVVIFQSSRSTEPRQLIVALKRTAALEAWFALLLSVGLLL